MLLPEFGKICVGNKVFNTGVFNCPVSDWPRIGRVSIADCCAADAAATGGKEKKTGVKEVGMIAG